MPKTPSTLSFPPSQQPQPANLTHLWYFSEAEIVLILTHLWVETVKKKTEEIQKSIRVQHKDNTGHSIRTCCLQKRPSSSPSSNCAPRVALLHLLQTPLLAEGCGLSQSYDYRESTSFTQVCLLKTTPSKTEREREGGRDRVERETLKFSLNNNRRGVRKLSGSPRSLK